MVGASILQTSYEVAGAPASDQMGPSPHTCLVLTLSQRRLLAVWLSHRRLSEWNSVLAAGCRVKDVIRHLPEALGDCPRQAVLFSRAEYPG